MTIGEAILAQQRILALELELARQKFGQMGNRGSSLESAFRSFLCSHLPRRLSIGTGEVVALVGDEGEQVSSQIDVIISDDTQPLNYAIDTPGLYLIEGVRFCGEIKSSFKSSKLIDEILKSRNVKSMRNLYYAKSLLQKDEKSHYSFRVPYFLFCFESQDKDISYILNIMSYIKSSRKIPFDCVVLLDKGIVILISAEPTIPGFSEGKYANFYFDEDGVTKIGSIKFIKTEAPLAVFMIWISMFQLNALGEFNSFGAYLQTIANDKVRNLGIDGRKIRQGESEKDYTEESNSRIESRIYENMKENPNHETFEYQIAIFQLLSEGII